MKYKLLTVLLMTVVLAGCGTKLPPNTSAEAVVAIRGAQVIGALRSVVAALPPLVCPPNVPKAPTCLSVAEADLVAAQMEKAANLGTELATALDLIDQAKTGQEKVEGMAKANLLLTNIQRLITETVIAPEHEAARTQLVNLFSNVTALLFAVRPSASPLP